MAQIERTPVLQQHKEIRWFNYNYPPLLRLIHFVPGEIPKQKKFLILSLFIVHLVIFGNTILNFIDSCAQGGLRILFSLLLLLFINPFILLIFYRGYTGICKEAGNLRLYIILQPIAIVIEIIIAIADFLGFNGFVRASYLLNMYTQEGFAGFLAIVVSVIFLSAALYSTFIYIRILRQRRELVSSIS